MGFEPFHVVSDPKYYLQEEGIEQATFHGNAADLLTFPNGRDFDLETYMRLYQGLDPATGERLTERARKANARNAYDFTLTLPKAATIPYLVMGDNRIQWAAKEANDYAMGMVQQQTVIRDQAGGVKSELCPDALVWMTVPHTFTRPVKDDGIEDPHAHFHNLVFNIAPHHGETLKWKALEFGHMDVRLVADAFHGRLAHNMRQLGYNAHWDGKDFEVYGIPKAIQDLYSRRHKECDVAKENARTERKKAKAAVISRAEKVPGVKLADRIKYWAGKMTRRQYGKVQDAVDTARYGYRKSRSASRMKAFVAMRQQSTMVREPERSVANERQTGWSR